MDTLLPFWNAPGGTGPIFALLLLLAAGFLLRFVLPAVRLVRELRQAVTVLEKMQAEGVPGDPDRIAREVMRTPALAHAWREYAQTLHGIVKSDAQQKPRTEWRATAQAECFFNAASLVETPLKTEFYKHLPGILTGIGIIGTFSGLIVGLSHFEVDRDASAVRDSLKTLIQNVGHAFQVSALAISLAMLATWVEKSLVTRACRLVTRLDELIDGCFEGGVEEEYLARLVRAGEITARQSAELRRGLVDELRQNLETLVRQQAEHAAAAQENLAAAVARAVGQSLEAPLARMAFAIEQAGAQQGLAAAKALEPLLERFTARLDGQLVQGQSGLEALLSRTADTLGRVVGELGALGQRLDGIGQQAVQRAAGELESAGEGVGQAAGTFSEASARLVAAAATLSNAAMEAGEVMREQRRSREAFATLIDEVKAIVHAARRDAGLSHELVARLEAAAQALGAAQTEAHDYLEGINRVLGEAHARFAENIERTLRQGNSQFQKEVATAIDYLKGAIEALGDTLENLTARP